MSSSDSPRESCISSGVQRARTRRRAATIATANEIRVRVEGWAKIRPSVRPAAAAARGRPSSASGEVEDRLDLGGDEVADPQQVAAGERDRERGVFTTSAPSPPRPRRLRRAAPSATALLARAARTSRRAPPRRPARARRGTGRPSRTSASAASVARSSGSAHAAASRSRSNASPRTSTASAPSAPATSRARGEHRRLVLLQVAVVGERQPLHRREQPGQPPDRGARLAARELGDVRRSASAASSTSRSPRPRAAARSRTRRSSRARAPRRSATGARRARRQA